MESLVSGVVDLGLRVADTRLEISTILVFGADPLGIFFELGGVVGSGEDVFEEDRVRNADRAQILHRGP